MFLPSLILLAVQSVERELFPFDRSMVLVVAISQLVKRESMHSLLSKLSESRQCPRYQLLAVQFINVSRDSFFALSLLRVDHKAFVPAAL